MEIIAFAIITELLMVNRKMDMECLFVKEIYFANCMRSLPRFVRRLATSTALIAAIGTAQAQTARPGLPVAQAPVAAAPAQIQTPSPEAMIIMIRSSIVALSQANVTNNYTVLNALGSRAFRTNNPPQQLAAVFRSFRDNNIDLSPVVYINPQLTAQPSLRDGKLHLVGNFPSSPLQVNFDLTFEPDAGMWKLFGLGVNLSQAPQAAAPPPR